MNKSETENFYGIDSYQPWVPERFRKNFYRINVLRDKLATLSHQEHSFVEELLIIKSLESKDIFCKDLLKKGKEEEQRIVLILLVERLLNDFCHYTYFGIISMQPAHLGPSYLLLRKPYEQTIPILEWMIADTSGFLNSFAQKVSDIDYYFKNKNEKVRVKNRKKTCKLLKFPLYSLLKDFLGLGSFDAAAHLITTRTNPTENLNMNFISLNCDSKLAEEHTDFLIYMNAIYLGYAYLLFMTLFESIDPEEIGIPKDLKERYEGIDYSYNILHGYALMLSAIIQDRSKESDIIDMFNSYLEVLEIKCPKCGNIIRVEKMVDIEVFADDEILYCSDCRAVIYKHKNLEVKRETMAEKLISRLRLFLGHI